MPSLINGSAVLSFIRYIYSMIIIVYYFINLCLTQFIDKIMQIYCTFKYWIINNSSGHFTYVAICKL